MGRPPPGPGPGQEEGPGPGPEEAGPVGHRDSIHPQSFSTGVEGSSTPVRVVVSDTCCGSDFRTGGKTENRWTIVPRGEADAHPLPRDLCPCPRNMARTLRAASVVACMTRVATPSGPWIQCGIEVVHLASWLAAPAHFAGRLLRARHGFHVVLSALATLALSMRLPLRTQAIVLL